MADDDSSLHPDFYLPSQFLTFDDIVSGFAHDDNSTSPQSTLLGCEAVLPTQHLLSKAAGEVAKMKLLNTTSSNGTGFFDCSTIVKLLQYPSQPPSSPPPKNTVQFPPRSPFCSQHFPQFRHLPPHMMVGQVHLSRPQKNKGIKKNSVDTKTNKTNNNGNNRPLGLPQSAWPPLPGQAQAQAQVVGPQRDSVGTGVFLPRQVTVTSDHKNKSDVNNALKTKSNKGLPRRNSRPIKTNDAEILLPSEWVY